MEKRIVIDSSGSCIFCKIINGALPAAIVFENESILVIKDINPKAPIHYLIIPKKHMTDLNELSYSDKELITELLLLPKQLATQLKGDQSYRLVVNNGANAGQIVFHLHLHFLAGF